MARRGLSSRLYVDLSDCAERPTTDTESRSAAGGDAPHCTAMCALVMILPHRHRYLALLQSDRYCRL